LRASTDSIRPSEDGKVDWLSQPSVGKFDIVCKALSRVAVAISSIAKWEVYGAAVRRYNIAKNGES
jgi:hypothetical protein